MRELEPTTIGDKNALVVVRNPDGAWSPAVVEEIDGADLILRITEPGRYRVGVYRSVERGKI